MVTVTWVGQLVCPKEKDCMQKAATTTMTANRDWKMEKRWRDAKKMMLTITKESKRDE